MRKESTGKTVVGIGDIHTGHRLAVSPLRWELPDEGVYQANKVQRALFKAWQDVVDDWKNPDILVVNGEPIDGAQPKNRGVEVWTTDFMEQIKASVELVKMFHAKKIYVTRGSNYHVTVDGVSVEEIFGQLVGAEKRDGCYVQPDLYIEVNETTFHFAHHISSSASGWQYKGTPISKEAMLMKLIESRVYPVDVICRNHVHYYWAIQSPSHLGMIIPCWQLQTWFMKQKSTAGTMPDIGAVRFTVGETKADYSWQKKLFKMDEWRPTKVKA